MQIKYKRKNLDPASWFVFLTVPSHAGPRQQDTWSTLPQPCGDWFPCSPRGNQSILTRDLSILLAPPRLPSSVFSLSHWTMAHPSFIFFASIRAEVHVSDDFVPLVITDVYAKLGGGGGHPEWLVRQHALKKHLQGTCFWF